MFLSKVPCACVCAAASSSAQGESKLPLWALTAPCPALKYLQAAENNLQNYITSVFLLWGFSPVFLCTIGDLLYFVLISVPNSVIESYL